MNTYYISPSVIPSRSANSIHVVNMSEALMQLGYDVVLFIRSEELDSIACRKVISSFYGVSNEKIEVVSYKHKVARGAELGIAMYALFRFIKDTLKKNSPRFIISRNLYAAALLGLLFRNKVIYETHSPEKGVRKRLQAWLLSSNKIQTVVISEALSKVIQTLHGVSNKNIHVFHDAARSGQTTLTTSKRHELQLKMIGTVVDLVKYNNIIGYFGHLYSGRGIEIIEGLAHKNPSYAFIVYGGNEKEIGDFKKKNTNNNLFFMGHLSPDKVHRAMAMMDILLMPYQESVSIGLDGVDTAQWMSPMKMFEYMSVGVPIISSNLPVLKEVLVDEVNCLLVQPDNIEDWSYAVRRISNSSELKETIAVNAYNDYLRDYTWESRAKRILDLFSSP